MLIAWDGGYGITTMNSSLKILILFLTITPSTFVTAKEPDSYVIAGQSYERDVVMKELNKARKTYGFDPHTRGVSSLEKLKAKKVTGKVLRQTGPKVIVQTDAGNYIAVQVRPNSSFKQDGDVNLAIKKRGSKVRERIDGNTFHSIQLYQDVTLSANEMVKALNNGKRLQGVSLSAVESRNKPLKVGDRPATQFDRRTMTIHRKGKKK